MRDHNVLLQECLARQEQAWAELRRMLTALLYSVGRERCGLDPPDVPEVVQETLLTLLADDMAVLRRFRHQSRFSTYLTGVALNVCRKWRSRYRTTNTVPLIDDLLPATWDDQNRVDFWNLVEVALSSLDMRILRLYADGYTAEEIAAKLSTPAVPLTSNNVYVRKHRALKTIKRFIEQSK